jgi:hypothetical protein
MHAVVRIGLRVLTTTCAVLLLLALATVPAAAWPQQPASGPAADEPSGAQGSAASASKFKWNWDTTLSYGLGDRVTGADTRLIGKAANGQAYSVNGDDGNQNYKRGLFTNAFKATSELELSYNNRVGAFVRGFAFYDIENQNGDRARTELTSAAKKRVGSRAEIRDAFAWARFKLGDHPGELRAGWQVINWGESTFIQGGINAVNPVDVSALRVPGSELRDAMLPVGAVKLSIKPSSATSIEGFYQYAWEETKVDPVGSYFSTTDLAGAGATKVMLGFGSAPDTLPVGHAPLPPSYSPIGSAVPKGTDVKARDGGQYGVAAHLFADKLFGTEFGAFFMNYHSRLPLIMAKTGTSAGLLGGNYAATAQYFLTYPEDIKLYGGSFNTQLGRTGIALQGEVSHRRNVPLQVDDVELLYAALSPLRLLSSLLPVAPQLQPIVTVGTVLASTNQLGGYGFSQEITGYKLFKTTQMQMTATKAFSRVLGADQIVLVAEAGWGKVHDLPDQSVLRLEAPGTYTSGNALHTTYGIQPATEETKAFVTPTAWGYVIAGKAEYNNAFSAVNVLPRFSFSQDVKGISPGPGGNFIEGRKGVTLGMGFQYRFNWELDFSYTNYFGAGRQNLLSDRDFVAANIKYSF